jgi:hypothetical protein
MSFARRQRRNGGDATDRRIRFLVASGALTAAQGLAVQARQHRGLSMEDALLALGTTEIGDAAAFDRTMAGIERARPEFAQRINALAARLVGCMDPAE